MNILFIEDMPEFKIQHVIKKLDSNFTYTIITNSSSALRYLFNKLNKIDLIILDLGISFSDDGSEYDNLGGLFIIEELIRKKLKIHLIINSTTKIPDEEELFERYEKHCGIIKHIPELDYNFLIKFIKENF